MFFSSKRLYRPVAVIAFSVLIVLSGLLLSERRVQKLPDGSRLELFQVHIARNGFRYRYPPEHLWTQMGKRVLPQRISDRLFQPLVGFGYSDQGNTSIVAITIRHDQLSAESPLERLRVSDDSGNDFDAAWEKSQIGLADGFLQSWRIAAFPRRSRHLHLHWLSWTGNSDWSEVADFQIPNPLRAQYPQWNPESWPITKSDQDLKVTLREFQSNGRVRGVRGQEAAAVAARKTRLVFSFEQPGTSPDDWRVQKIIISDATGNHWAPNLDFSELESKRGAGEVEFLGALWPEEQAWKLEVEAVRTRRFTPDESWEVSLSLPPAGTVVPLTNRWILKETALLLTTLGGPGAQISGSPESYKWWVINRNKVYSLGLNMSSGLAGYRVQAVSAVDEMGRDVAILRHDCQDAEGQVIFFRPQDGATQVRLKLSAQRSRFVQFLARPDFVKD